MGDLSSEVLNGSFLLFSLLVLMVVFYSGLRGARGLWRLLRSVKFAVVLIAIISLFTVIGSTIVQGRAPQEYHRLYGEVFGRLLVFFGFNDVFYALWFNSLLVVLCVSIFTCLWHGLRFSWRRLGFIVTRVGLLIIGIGAVVTGLFGLRGRMILYEGESSAQFYRTASGGRMSAQGLPFSVVCKRFWMDHYDSGNGNLIVFRPNGHYENHFEAKPGTEYYSPSHDVTIRVIEVFRDFAMDEEDDRPISRTNKWRNPAALIEVDTGESTEREILFYLRPGMRTNPDLRDIPIQYSRAPQSLSVKSYNSRLCLVENGRVVREKTIVVNDPLRYEGYTFYQSDWDKEREAYTILEVKKDPGEKIFYVGGSLVMVGVVIVFYVNPLVRRRRQNRSC